MYTSQISLLHKLYFMPELQNIKVYFTFGVGGGSSLVRGTGILILVKGRYSARAMHRRGIFFSFSRYRQTAMTGF